MSMIPMIPDSAPFTPEQRAWLNGFLAGVLNRGAAPAGVALPAGATVADERLLVLFGSQSGNAESFAKRLAKMAGTRGYSARAAGLDAVKPEALPEERNVLFITSTWGEGDMPDNAQGFWDAINQNGSSPKLGGLRYSVLALGDRNYGDTFCLAGRRLDERLAELGASRIASRVDCDVEYEEPATRWSEAVFAALKGDATALSQTPAVEPAEDTGWSKKNPFPAALIDRYCLNGEKSAKVTNHIAFSLKDSGLVYETGDALGVKVKNCPDVVDGVIAAHGLDPLSAVGSSTLRDALISEYEVRHLVGKPVEKPADLETFLSGLRRLQPRLYSISSSPKAHPDEVHLTIGVVKYEADGVAHKGVASTYLGERLAMGDTAGVFVHTAKHFRLPADIGRPVIMVGPGTGIAPFRAFLEERQMMGGGKNWLFFGDQRRSTDFLYQEQIIGWVKSGHLTRLDTAFSRDQEEKIYVQQRMMEASQELWAWLEEGAHFYVCGDAKRMAKDVDVALRQVIQKAGGRSAEEADAYVESMKQAKRYQRDVY